MIENIRKALEKFNRHRIREVSASLMESNSSRIKIKFSGALLCNSCCLNDYFEDFMYDLKDNGVDNQVKWINTDEQNINFVVEYEIL